MDYKSDWEQHLDGIKAQDDAAQNTYRTPSGKHGRESVVVWLMLAAVLGGLLTRSLSGAIVGAVLMWIGWFLFKKSFGGRFMGGTVEPSLLVRWGVIGGVSGFTAAFVAGLIGLSISLFFATLVGATVGTGYYQFVLAARRQ